KSGPPRRSAISTGRCVILSCSPAIMPLGKGFARRFALALSLRQGANIPKNGAFPGPGGAPRNPRLTLSRHTGRSAPERRERMSMAFQSLAYVTTDAAPAALATAAGRPAARVLALSRARPKILFATSEIADFVQTGGLAAVSASLPRVLKPACDVRVVLPGYRSVLAKAAPLSLVETLPGHAGLPPCTLASCTLADGLVVYVVLCDELYGRDGAPYADAHGQDYGDNDIRFARLSLAVAEIAEHGAGRWRPDVVHLNDWPTALAAGYLAWRGVETPALLTVHNLPHQGLFAANRLDALGVPASAFGIDGVEFYGKL